MRESCLFCATKHISEAIILLGEAMLGYPLHIHLACGHLAEAEIETVAEFPEFAEEIRDVRLTLNGQDAGIKLTSKTMMELLEKARRLAEVINGEPDEVRTARILEQFHTETQVLT